MARYWHDPETALLSADERQRVYRIQCELGAVKRCRACNQVKPVAAFVTYGVLTCRVCPEFTGAPPNEMQMRTGVLSGEAAV